MTLDRDDILAGLGELAGELNAAGLELTIHVVGGAAIALEYNPDRQATSNIDAWVNARPAVRERVVRVVKQIAIRRRWPDDWLNEKAVMIIPEGVGSGPQDWRPTLEVGKVRVFVAQPKMVLAMKLRAGRGRRDLPDLEPLLAASGLLTIEDDQETFDNYYPHDDMKPLSRHWLEEILPHLT
jgi:hypothetical protein